MEEMRVGLKPILWRAWTAVGVRPVAGVRLRSQWTCGYCLVRPAPSAPGWLLPRVDTLLFGLVLAHFVRAVGAGANQRGSVVLDRARWHTGGGLAVPESLRLEFLPAYSPEPRPAKRR